MKDDDHIDPGLLRPILETGKQFFITVAALLAVFAWGVYAWLHQLALGLGVTGLNRPVFWGIYIANFIFFIGISHAGTLISAILRLTGAEWRRPITRAAEAITVFALMVGPLNILIDLGRPDRALNVFKYGRLQSPLLWDVISISTYFIGSSIYLYLPLIPDIALVRDRTSRRKRLYRLLALGWTGTERQKRFLKRAIGAMAVVIIPIAVSVHTVVSWVLAMTLQPMWHSTIFGPYFVVGAIFSGIASIIIAMAVLRKVFHLEGYLKPIHFHNLGLLLLTMALIWFYFTFAEYLTTFYGDEPEHMAVFWSKWSGEFAPLFWAMVLLNVVVPFLLLTLPRLGAIERIPVPSLRPWPAAVAASAFALLLFLAPPRLPVVGIGPGVNSALQWGALSLSAILFLSVLPTLRAHPIATTVIASVSVNVGMWLERFIIVVPTLTRPRIPYQLGIYRPTWVEWSITAALFAGLILLYVLFSKLFPIVSVWEIKEGEEAERVYAGASAVNARLGPAEG